MLASILFPYDEDAPNLIESWLTELDNEECIVQYRHNNGSYIEICNWLSHQKIDKPSASKLPSSRESSRILANPREMSSGDLGPGPGSKDRERKTPIVPFSKSERVNGHGQADSFEPEQHQLPNDFDPSTPTRHRHDQAQINAFFAHWNNLGLPEFRRLLVNIPEAGKLLEALSYYSAEEITAAIDAYHTAMTDPEYELGFSYATVVNFLIKGLESFAPGAKPLNRYRKRRNGEQSSDDIAAEANRISEARRQGAAV